MGVVGNRHFFYEPAHRAEAERIAALRLGAIGRVSSGCADFDATGQRYWENDAQGSAEAAREGFASLRTALVALRDASRADVELSKFHPESPKAKRAAQMGFARDYSPETFTARMLIADQRLIEHIDHVLTTEGQALEALARGNLELVYSLLSTPCRALLDVAAWYTSELVAVARLTHEISDVVRLVWSRDHLDRSATDGLDMTEPVPTPATSGLEAVGSL